MSCKILRDTSPEDLQPLFRPELKKPPTLNPKPWQIEGEQAAQDNAEQTRLRAKITELEGEMQRRIPEAHQAGFTEGEAAGYERASAAARPGVEKLAHTIHEISTLRGRIREETESDLLALSLAIARRILRRELTVDPDAIQGLIRAALDKVQSRDITRVRIHSGHQSVISQYLSSAGVSGVELITDPVLQPGDVIVETKRGNLEASIETQLAEIERGFADRIGR